MKLPEKFYFYSLLFRVVFFLLFFVFFFHFIGIQSSFTDSKTEKNQKTEKILLTAEAGDTGDYWKFLKSLPDSQQSASKEELTRQIEKIHAGNIIPIDSTIPAPFMKELLIDVLNLRPLLETQNEQSLRLSTIDETKFPDRTERMLEIDDPFVGRFKMRLVLPNGKGPFPGILALHGHDEDADSYYALYNGYQYPEKGFALLIPTFRAMVGGKEVSLLSEGLLRKKFSLMAIRIYEALVAKKVMESLPEIDAGRIGMIGHSGGSIIGNIVVRIDSSFKAYVTDSASNYIAIGQDSSYTDETVPRLYPYYRILKKFDSSQVPILLVSYRYKEGFEDIFEFFDRFLKDISIRKRLGLWVAYTSSGFGNGIKYLLLPPVSNPIARITGALVFLGFFLITSRRKQGSHALFWIPVLFIVLFFDSTHSVLIADVFLFLLLVIYLPVNLFKIDIEQRNLNLTKKKYFYMALSFFLLVPSHYFLYHEKYGLFVIQFCLYVTLFFFVRFKAFLFFKLEVGILFLSFLGIGVLLLIDRKEGVFLVTATELFFILNVMIHLGIVVRNHAFRDKYSAVAALIFAVLACVSCEKTLINLSLPFPQKEESEKRNPLEKMISKEGMCFGKYGTSLSKGLFIAEQKIGSKNSDVTRIILQRSFQQQKNQSDWPKLLEQKLNQLESNRKFEVLDSKFPGLSSFGMLQDFKHSVQKYHPDILLWYLGADDQMLKRGPFTDREFFQEFIKPFGGRKKSIAALTGMNKFRIFRLLKAETTALQQGVQFFRICLNESRFGYQSRVRATHSIVQAVPPDEIFTNLKELKRICRENGVVPVFCWKAEVFSDVTNSMEEWENAAGRLDIPFIDGNQIKNRCEDEKKNCFNRDFRLSPTGKLFLADLIGKLLVQMEFLPNGAPGK